MARILDLYIQKRDELLKNMPSDEKAVAHLIILSEMNYRIDVLQTCKAFVSHAPVTQELSIIQCHYQQMDAYIRFMQAERKFGWKTDERGYKKRETAASSLARVADDYRRQFASFKASSDQQYRECVQKVINTVLPVWTQYRDTYVEINIKN